MARMANCPVGRSVHVLVRGFCGEFIETECGERFPVSAFKISDVVLVG